MGEGDGHDDKEEEVVILVIFLLNILGVNGWILATHLRGMNLKNVTLAANC